MTKRERTRQSEKDRNITWKIPTKRVVIRQKEKEQDNRKNTKNDTQQHEIRKRAGRHPEARDKEDSRHNEGEREQIRKKETG